MNNFQLPQKSLPFKESVSTNLAAVLFLLPSPAGIEDCLSRLPFLPLAGESWIGGLFSGRDRSRQFFARIESHELERVEWARFCPEGVLAPFGCLEEVLAPFGCAHAVSRIAYRVGKPRKTFGRAPG